MSREGIEVEVQSIKDNELLAPHDVSLNGNGNMLETLIELTGVCPEKNS